jgi:hypothetical protein
MSDGAAVVAGATISGVIGVLVVVVQQWIVHTRDQQKARVERLAEFSAAGWVLTLCTGDLAQAERPNKPSVEAAHSEKVDRFVHALAQVQLLDDASVYEVAHDVDKELTKLIEAARSRVYSVGDWDDARTSLTEAVLRFQRTARRALDAPEIQLRRPSSDVLRNEELAT